MKVFMCYRMACDVIWVRMWQLSGIGQPPSHDFHLKYLDRSICNYHHMHLHDLVKKTNVHINAKQKHLGYKKGEANQKQQLSDYRYVAILATKNFDMKLRSRISYL